MRVWVLLVILYSIFKGIRDPIKKKALDKDDLLNALFFYTVFGLLLTIPTSYNQIPISMEYFLLILVKSAVIFIAWSLSALAVKHIPVSIYGVVDTSRIIFTTLLGIFILGEEPRIKVIVGMILVIGGIICANLKKDEPDKKYQLKYIAIMVLSCAMSAVSEYLDKYIMSKGGINADQLQFWFMLILSVFYLGAIYATGNKLQIKSCMKNPYIYLLSILLIVGDKCIFIANADKTSMVTVMTLIKQSSMFITIVCGKLFYKEKNIILKLLCSLVIIAGIVLAVI